MLRKLVGYYLSSFFKPSYLLCVVVSYVLNVFLVNSSYYDFIPNGYVNKIVFMFYMPLNLHFDLLRWLLISLPILLPLSSFILRELNERPAYFILRMKSYNRWFHSIFISTFIIIIVTIMIAIGITGITILLFNSKIVASSEIGLSSFQNTNGWGLLLNQFSLLIFTMILLLILHTICSFLVSNNVFAMLLIIISMISSVVIGSLFPSLLKVLPLTYCLFAFRELKETSFFWSNSIILIGIFLSYGLLYFLFNNLKEKVVSF
jgi:hypothetical protein